MNVLLSIKPRFADEILKGNKKYEFRKSVFKKSSGSGKVYIYSTAPIKKIVGSFTIESIIEDYPCNLWKMFNKYSGIKKDEFFEYFKNKQKGYAIKIKEVEVYKNPIDPKLLFPDFYPPQSYCYFKSVLEQK